MQSDNRAEKFTTAGTCENENSEEGFPDGAKSSPATIVIFQMWIFLVSF